MTRSRPSKSPTNTPRRRRPQVTHSHQAALLQPHPHLRTQRITACTSTSSRVLATDKGSSPQPPSRQSQSRAPALTAYQPAAPTLGDQVAVLSCHTATGRPTRAPLTLRPLTLAWISHSYRQPPSVSQFRTDHRSPRQQFPGGAVDARQPAAPPHLQAATRAIRDGCISHTRIRRPGPARSHASLIPLTLMLTCA